jgi:DNA-binding winged helix-turn-helix (wHTH) protein
MLTTPLLVFGPCRLDPAGALLWRGDEQISLRPKTFEVLCYLIEHSGKLVTKAELLDAVWAEVSVSDTMPAICVAELRKALGDDARHAVFIETVHKRGYRFIAKVTTAASEHSAKLPPVRLEPAPIVVGREDAIARLQEWYNQAANGERRVVFVTGEAGIGKTTLIRAFLNSIGNNGIHIGRGQCIEQYGAGEPYMPVLEALTRLGQEPGGERLVEILNRLAPAWLAQMPALLGEADRARLQGAAQEVTQKRLLRELTLVLEALAADLPLVLFFEDLHWSDLSTLTLIAAIARRTERARLLIIGTYRTVAMLTTEHPLRTMKLELELHRFCEEHRLQLLRQEDIAAYLTQRFAGDATMRP